MHVVGIVDLVSILFSFYQYRLDVFHRLNLKTCDSATIINISAYNNSVVVMACIQRPFPCLFGTFVCHPRINLRH